MPTLLDHLQIDSEQPLDGRSLLDALQDPTASLEPRPAWIESHSAALAFDWAKLEGVRTEQWKFVRGARPHLFDLRADPGELQDIAEDHPDQVAELEQILERLARRGPTLDRSTRTLSSAEMRALGGIGYVPAVAPADATDSGPGEAVALVDPMDHVADMDRIELAQNLAQADQLSRAAELLQQLAKEFPNTFLVHQALGNCLGRMGQHTEALAALRRAEELHDHLPDLQASIAIACFQLDDIEGARRALEKGTELPGCEARLFWMLHELYTVREQRPERGRAALRRMLEHPDVDPSEKERARAMLGTGP